ncbi:MAG: CubicO group peptidase beta-lactamase class family [Mucilaginibacter sp.]|nr:CubicO group peptidase beta-lactamase class family [Mucilaginibacter sp.]
MKIISLFFVLIFADSAAHGQNIAKLDSLVSIRYQNIAPGCVILVAKKGRVIYRKAFGVVDRKTLTPMRPDHVFLLGSMSKQYTAIAILKLAEQGSIKLQDSIQVYVKDFPHKVFPVTIENLLSQTSGIINFQDIKNPDPKLVRENYTPAQGVDYFKNEPLQFKPGSRFEYSNSNFFLLGYIIELVTGQTYGSYIQQHVLAPAGLLHTYYLWPGKVIPDLASGYSRFDHKHWEDAELQNVTMLYATGGLAADIDDVWRWHQALMENKLVSQKMLESAWRGFQTMEGTPQYGYGWFIKNIDGLKTVEHSGSTDGYQTDEVYFPEKDLFIAALFNGFEADMDWQVLTNDIARLALGDELRIILKLSEDSLKRFEGTYRYNQEHEIVIKLKDHRLYVEATNPKDRLPSVELLAQSPMTFYIKEAQLQFLFVPDPENQQFKLQTFIVPGKNEEWKKVR